MAQERNGAGRRNENSENGRGQRQDRNQRREYEQGSSGWHGEGYGGSRRSEDANEFGGEGRFREHGGRGSHFGGAPEERRQKSAEDFDRRPEPEDKSKAKTDTEPGETGPPRSGRKTET